MAPSPKDHFLWCSDWDHPKPFGQRKPRSGRTNQGLDKVIFGNHDGISRSCRYINHRAARCFNFQGPHGANRRLTIKTLCIGKMMEDRGTDEAARSHGMYAYRRLRIECWIVRQYAKYMRYRGDRRVGAGEWRNRDMGIEGGSASEKSSKSSPISAVSEWWVSLCAHILGMTRRIFQL